MGLENILLGLLAEPASGYDLKRAFDTAINYFWYADIAQVYRTLQRMEEKGLLKSKEVLSDQGPPRKVYRRTAAGRKQLFAWLREAPEFNPERHTYVAQLAFMGQLSDLDRTVEFFRQMRDRLTSRLAVLKHIEASEPETDILRMSEEGLHGLLSLQMGIRTTEARIKGCDVSIQLVRRRLSHNNSREEKT